MTRRVCSKWLSHKMTRIYCIDFSGCGSDQTALEVEFAAVQAIFAGQPPRSLLATLDLGQTDFSPEIVTFLNQAFNMNPPFRKLAVIGISQLQRTWYRLTRRVAWPANTAFFESYEPAKNWLVSERSG